MADKTGTAPKRPTLTPEQKAAKQAQKAADFKRLGEKRVSNALRAIRLVGRLSNKSTYAWTDEQVQAIYTALGQAVRDVQSQFAGKAESAPGFTL